MGDMLYRALENLYGGGFITRLVDVLSDLLTVLSKTGAGYTIVRTGFSVLGGIACSFVVLCFLMEMTEMAMRDMMSFEKLCVGFVKLIAAVAIIACAEDITYYLIDIGKLMFQLAKETFTGSLSDAVDGYLFDSTKITVEKINKEIIGGDGMIKGIAFFISHLFMMFSCLLIMLATFIIKLAGYFVAVSSVLMLCVRLFFAPIAVVQIFQGANSAGIRYIKSTLADACSLAGMVVIIAAATMISSSLVGSNISGIELTVESFQNALSVDNVVLALVPQVAAVGGMAGVSRVLHEVFA